MPMAAVAPQPPADLNERELPLIEFPVGHAWYRLHRRQDAAMHFGRSGRSRFDAPARQYGVLYVGETARACFAETFLREPGRTLIGEDDIAAKLLSRIAVTRTVRLVRLRGRGLARIGATASVSSGPRQLSQAWSLALWRHPQQPDGLLYRSRHDDDEICAALFERAREHLDSNVIECLLDMPTELADILDAYGVGLA